VVALVPLPVVTRTSTVPEPAGAKTVILLADCTQNHLALVLPNLTDVAPLRLAPVMTTVLPPSAGPLAGLRPLTDGTTAALAGDAKPMTKPAAKKTIASKKTKKTVRKLDSDLCIGRLDIIALTSVLFVSC
jgi:hypothetical protein